MVLVVLVHPRLVKRGQHKPATPARLTVHTVCIVGGLGEITLRTMDAAAVLARRARNRTAYSFCVSVNTNRAFCRFFRGGLGCGLSG